MTEQPRIKRAGLGSQFKGAGTDRASGLSGLLPPARPERSRPDEKPADRPREAAAPVVEEPKQPSPKQSPAGVRDNSGSPRTSKAAKTGLQNVTAYLEPEVFAAVRIARRDGVDPNERDKTYDELLVEALNKVGADSLREHFAPAEVLSGSLLQGRKRAGIRAATVQRQIRLDSGQIAALDALAQEVGAKDRTSLINAAYRLAFVGS